MKSDFKKGLLAVLLAVPGCVDGGAGELLPPGGDTTSSDRTASAYENPAPNLSPDDLARHLDGDVAFEATFVSAPAEVNPGLGPVFNHASCAGCHVRNGRGLPLTGHPELGSPLLVRVSLADGASEVPNAPVPVPGLGTQIQDHAIYGHAPEATVRIVWVEEPGTYDDGTPYVLRRPVLDIQVDGAPLAPEVLTSPRIPPPVFGLGLLEAVPEAAILALADPDDADGDGISGRANRAWSVAEERAVLGRFGWKANTPDLTQQAGGAYADDMGVSSPMFPDPGAPETSDVDLETVRLSAFYTRSLAVPRRGPVTAEVERGEALFREVGCDGCHVAELTTGAHDLAALRDQLIAPYTDLLLHDMGPELADGRPDFLASGAEWRTPPLWGIGVAERVLPSAAYLHDGRARTLEEAILWHGGEGASGRDAFRALSAADRAALIAFLRSL